VQIVNESFQTLSWNHCAAPPAGTVSGFKEKIYFTAFLHPFLPPFFPTNQILSSFFLGDKCFLQTL
jgi:hypothetical protein